MTKLELIDAYAAGRIDRRDFVARLTGLGISAAAALAYAQSFAPSASAASSRGHNGYVVRMQDSTRTTNTALRSASARPSMS